MRQPPPGGGATGDDYGCRAAGRSVAIATGRLRRLEGAVGRHAIGPGEAERVDAVGEEDAGVEAAAGRDRVLEVPGRIGGPPEEVGQADEIGRSERCAAHPVEGASAREEEVVDLSCPMHVAERDRRRTGAVHAAAPRAVAGVPSDGPHHGTMGLLGLLVPSAVHEQQGEQGAPGREPGLLVGARRGEIDDLGGAVLLQADQAPLGSPGRVHDRSAGGTPGPQRLVAEPLGELEVAVEQGETRSLLRSEPAVQRLVDVPGVLLHRLDVHDRRGDVSGLDERIDPAGEGVDGEVGVVELDADLDDLVEEVTAGVRVFRLPVHPVAAQQCERDERGFTGLAGLVHRDRGQLAGASLVPAEGRIVGNSELRRTRRPASAALMAASARSASPATSGSGRPTTDDHHPAPSPTPASASGTGSSICHRDRSRRRAARRGGRGSRPRRCAAPSSIRRSHSSPSSRSATWSSGRQRSVLTRVAACRSRGRGW